MFWMIPAMMAAGLATSAIEGAAAGDVAEQNKKSQDEANKKNLKLNALNVRASPWLSLGVNSNQQALPAERPWYQGLAGGALQGGMAGAGLWQGLEQQKFQQDLLGRMYPGAAETMGRAPASSSWKGGM